MGWLPDLCQESRLLSDQGALAQHLHNLRHDLDPIALRYLRQLDHPAQPIANLRLLLKILKQQEHAQCRADNIGTPFHRISRLRANELKISRRETIPLETRPLTHSISLWKVLTE